MTDYEIRPARTDDDLARNVEIHNVVRPRDVVAVADARSFIEQTQANAAYTAFVDDDAVAAARVALLHDRAEPIADVLVLDTHRRRGIGSGLYAQVSEWIRARGFSVVDVVVEEDDRDGLAFATNRGFREIGREIRVVLDLRTQTPVVAPPPDGIEIVTWADRPDVVRGMYDVAVEAFRDIPGDENEPVLSFERWLADHMQGSGDRPEATFVALHRDEVVGYSKFSFTTSQPTTAHHDLTGVKRAWRGRGIARALKSVQIEWARRNGYERLVTRNEERNAPIRRLNEEFGYRRDSVRLTMRGPVSAAT